VLVAAVRAGAGREGAYDAVKQHAVAVALEMREKGTERNDLLERLALDSRLGLSAADLDTVLAEPLSFTGAARAQVAAIVASVDLVLATEPAAAQYQPEPIL
jgi:adenylosuccinate lyase